jgi:hypothetical protein
MENTAKVEGMLEELKPFLSEQDCWKALGGAEMMDRLIKEGRLKDEQEGAA